MKPIQQWIDEYGGKDKIFFDVGANIGVYSLYYAFVHKAAVFSFEPSFRNLDLLVKNIRLNNLSDYISVISNPVFNKETFDKFFQSENIAGLAESTFGENNKKANHYKTLSISLNQLIKKNIIKKPNLIKIDVDGNEAEVINGATEIISSEECYSILVETRPSTNEIIEKILKENSYEKREKMQHHYSYQK